MHAHYLQHVPFEGLGSIETWLQANHYQITHSPLFVSPILPDLDDIDLLIIMGGPMGVYDETKYPWLINEKKFIELAIKQQKPIIGICLGAQLLACVLGASVHKNKHREIGWFDIFKTPEANTSPLVKTFPEKAHAFHWHGDTFDIPQGATHFASSEACPNQGFTFNDHIIALQFHLETTEQTAKSLIENCDHALDDSTYVQTKEKILANPSNFAQISQLQASILETLAPPLSLSPKDLSP